LLLTVADIYQLAAEIKAYRIPQFALQKYRTFPGDKRIVSQTQIDSFFDDSELISSLKKDFNQLVLR
jgi:hypothetical protein